MAKILITGNGFDLHHKLPTKYQDFLEIMLKIEAIKEKENYCFDDLFTDIKQKEDLEKSFKIENLKFKQEHILSLKESLKNNIWFQYFKEEYMIETWIDFESKIEKAINFAILFIKKTSAELTQNPKTSLPVYYYNIINNSIEAINSLRKLKIILSDNIDSPINTIELRKEFLIYKYNYYININEDAILNHLKQQLDDFKNIFNYYFDLIINSFLENPKSENKAYNLLNSIDYYYTFNYTDTFKKLYKNSKIKNNIFNVHGKSFLEKQITTSSEEHSIVLGFNDIDETILNKKFYFPFTKYYQKLKNNTDYKFIKDLDLSNKSSYIYIWGHSLDKSDKDYVDEIFEFLLDKNLSSSYERKLFIIYHDEISKSNMLLNLLSIRGKKDVEHCMRSNKLEFIKSDYQNLNEYFNKHEKAPISMNPGFY